ncbi:MAG TPA: adenylyl-sulfate kinase [Nitrospiraceae bacterium]|nr:adenylyl-sulfate kinase [Nitrospiraceae bacterium]
MSFAIWITGLPASGKSTITAALRLRLEATGLRVEVLESDAVRHILTPSPSYSHEERDLFYRALAFVGSRLVVHGVTVIFDATAGKQAYREFARRLIARFIEVAVECPLEVCMARDQKGTYRKGLAGESKTVPGLQVPYEAPLTPDLRIESEHISPTAAADRILAVLHHGRLVLPES